ncbi:MAG: antitoxin [Acidimicrobiales bacterium]
MPRTTLDIDASVLDELKRRRRREQKTLGQVASELLARALAQDDGDGEPPALVWTSRPLGLQIDLEDKEALRRILDEG